jgi:hypothetical protein
MAECSADILVMDASIDESDHPPKAAVSPRGRRCLARKSIDSLGDIGANSCTPTSLACTKHRASYRAFCPVC